MIKAVLFDFDGTLADTLPLYVKAYDTALKKIGFQFNTEKISRTCFNNKEDKICLALGVPDKIKDFTNAYFSAAKSMFKEIELFDDSITTLQFLKKKGIKNVIITFAYKWYIDSVLKEKNLQGYFDLIISADDVKNSKPDPEAVLKTQKLLNLNTDEMIVVGDAKNDILMGKNARVKTVLFSPKNYSLYYDKEDLYNTRPDHIINRISELNKII